MHAWSFQCVKLVLLVQEFHMDRKLTTQGHAYQPTMVINMIMDHMMHHMTDCGHAHPVRLFTNQRTNNTILV